MTPETKAVIDRSSYEQLLRVHRFAKAGDPRFQGAEGEYRCKRLAELRDNEPTAAVAASKLIGWTQ